MISCRNTIVEASYPNRRICQKNDETAGCVKGTKHRYLDSAIGICTIDKQKDRLVLHHRSMEVVKGHTQVNQVIDTQMDSLDTIDLLG